MRAFSICFALILSGLCFTLPPTESHSSDINSLAKTENKIKSDWHGQNTIIRRGDGVQMCKGGFDLISLPNFCFKIHHENERIWTQKGVRVTSTPNPSGSTMRCKQIYVFGWILDQLRESVSRNSPRSSSNSDVEPLNLPGSTGTGSLTAGSTLTSSGSGNQASTGAWSLTGGSSLSSSGAGNYNSSALSGGPFPVSGSGGIAGIFGNSTAQGGSFLPGSPGTLYGGNNTSGKGNTGMGSLTGGSTLTSSGTNITANSGKMFKICSKQCYIFNCYNDFILVYHEHSHIKLILYDPSRGEFKKWGAGNQQNDCAPSEESSLCAQWVAKDPSFLHADSEDSDLQWVHMPFFGFVIRRLKCV